MVDSASGPVYRTWFGRILRDMAEIGYDCEWHCISAGGTPTSPGAPHRRERVWIVAYPNGKGLQRMQNTRGSGKVRTERNERTARCCNGKGQDVGNPVRRGQPGQGQSVNTSNPTQDGERQANQPEHVSQSRIGTTEPGLGLLANGIAARLAGSRWLPEPGIGRVAVGVPDRVQKLKALGNGLVWQIPAAIGAAIAEREA